MAFTAKTLTFRMRDLGGDNLTHAKLQFDLQNYDTSGVDIYAGAITVDVPAMGTGTVDVMATNALEYSSVYHVTLIYWSELRETMVRQSLGAISPTVSGSGDLAALLAAPGAG